MRRAVVLPQDVGAAVAQAAAGLNPPVAQPRAGRLPAAAQASAACRAAASHASAGAVGPCFCRCRHVPSPALLLSPLPTIRPHVLMRLPPSLPNRALPPPFPSGRRRVRLPLLNPSALSPPAASLSRLLPFPLFSPLHLLPPQETFCQAPVA
ncbi:unnamed protein product [Closterium sp. Naga37s-1]|nr:unnamed protein product [Closterium sp. Naga37s-1]